MRRDTITVTYRSAQDFQRHAAQMRQNGWLIGEHTDGAKKAMVTWYRDTPTYLPPNAYLPTPPSNGLHPAAIVGIVLGGIFVVLVLVLAASSGGKTAATVTPVQSGGVSIPPPSTLATTPNTTTNVAAAATPAPTETLRPFTAPWYTAEAAKVTPPAVPQVVAVVDNPVKVLGLPGDDATAFATLDVGTELSVVGPDATGSDGTTRWVHVAANGRDGFVRSDLVSTPHVYVPPTATPRPPTVTPDPNAPVTVRGRTLALTIRGGYDPAPLGRFDSKKAGYRYVAFDVTVENISSSTQSYSILFASITTTDDRKYNATIAATSLDPILAGGSLAPGERNRGWLIFEIPAGSRIATVSYQDFSNNIGFRYT